MVEIVKAIFVGADIVYRDVRNEPINEAGADFIRRNGLEDEHSAGIAKLAGGSLGIGDNSRQDDGWYWAGGVGLRYALQARTGVDMRLDLVRTSDEITSIYLTLNQAF